MKKFYMQPSTEVVTVETQKLLEGSLTLKGDADDIDQLSREGHREWDED